jgi:hypothetical protein
VSQWYLGVFPGRNPGTARLYPHRLARHLRVVVHGEPSGSLPDPLPVAQAGDLTGRSPGLPLPDQSMDGHGNASANGESAAWGYCRAVRRRAPAPGGQALPDTNRRALYDEP